VDADQLAAVPSKDTELNIYKEQYYENEEDDNEQTIIEEDYGMLESMCTLRRASAFAFEHLAKCASEEIFSSFSEHLSNYLQSDDLQGREAAILVLGVLCTEGGCYENVVPY